MLSDAITIIVTRDGQFYYAVASDADVPFRGGSPDEAVGWLVRERLLSSESLTIREIVSMVEDYVVERP